MKILASYCHAAAALTVLLHLLGDESSVAVTATVAGSFMILGRILVFLADRRIQRKRDRRARAILDRTVGQPETRDSPYPSYVLWLRPFSTTGRLLVANPRKRWLPLLPAYFAREPTVEFESVLANALAPQLDLVALGRPGEHVGAGRIAVSDEHWRNAFFRLVDHASWILMIPSDAGETRWEIDQLMARDALPRVVFVMPPRLRGSIDTACYWQRIRDGLQTAGLQLPAFAAGGALFRPGRRLESIRMRYLPELDAAFVRQRFYAVTGSTTKRP